MIASLIKTAIQSRKNAGNPHDYCGNNHRKNESQPIEIF